MILGWCYSAEQVAVTKEKQMTLMEAALATRFSDFRPERCFNRSDGGGEDDDVGHGNRVSRTYAPSRPLAASAASSKALSILLVGGFAFAYLL